MNLAAALALVACASCAAPWTHERYDVVSRSSGARTIVHEPGFSLYSPYGATETAAWVAEALQLDEELTRRLGAHASPWVIVLDAHEDLRPQIRIEVGSLVVGSTRVALACGIAGLADGRTVRVFVAPPTVLEHGGEALTVSVAPSNHRGTLAHELAHVHLLALGIRAPWWLDEGFAHLVAAAVHEHDGRVVLGDWGAVADPLADLSEAELDLARTLAFREDVGAIAAGEPHPFPAGRRVAASFVRFLLARAGDPVAELRELASARRSDLLARERAWRDWLRSAHEAGAPESGH
jgi:hypothetical protein